ncbi:GTPase domain-containing protein [Phormidium sp. LEGE 05292]|uniref:GTPase domain-containing protein n=1 Tax=[Phormidium] sp. LEGE 05292 TaxID=767427 RepID=UPI00187F8727|nr:GTPase domain-containing protein [Phormidium sp. LEGE 05292]MBE9224107.1 GTPase domain-containing protein [Phormidium sp. LEGE 05292]
MSKNALESLKFLFQDRPDVTRLLDIRELDLSDREDDAFIEQQGKQELFPKPVNLYATGRTGAGKTTLGRRILDPKQTIDTKQAVMGSTGKTDCTWMVQFFQMLSNLRYYDLPGAGGCNDTYENINRAALLIRQVDDDDLQPVDKFEVWDCSDYPKTKQVKKRIATVQQWQSQENQEYVAPDIILYVVAPHTQFTREDQRYLKALLKFQKERGSKNKVIFALNIHHQDRTKITTQENIDDAREKIINIYQSFYSDQPPIVEVDCLRGTGINKITELMCKILPDNKIGNMGQALQDELKAIAKKERSRRYRQALIYIASRLATYKVDEKLGQQGILEEAYAAICDYAIRIFREEDARAAAERELYEMVDSFATEAKLSREEAIKILVPDVVEEDVTQPEIVGYTPKYKTVDIEEEVPDYREVTEKVKRSAIARAGLGVVEGVARTITSPISGIQKLFGVEKTIGDKIHKEIDRDAYRNENVIKAATRKIKKTEERMIGMEAVRQDVTRKVQKVVQKEKEVGKNYLQGGYPVVENLLAIGLGIENADPAWDLQNDFESIVEAEREQVKAMLTNQKDEINKLAVNSDPRQAEVRIIWILEQALMN